MVWRAPFLQYDYLANGSECGAGAKRNGHRNNGEPASQKLTSATDHPKKPRPWCTAVRQFHSSRPGRRGPANEIRSALFPTVFRLARPNFETDVCFAAATLQVRVLVITSALETSRDLRGEHECHWAHDATSTSRGIFQCSETHGQQSGA
ncbi:hypothetical protein VFPFJ_09124 [Purpureocillium lilacinum]|uniref:Uncharacterized protein n=1 Tax=Purpureocillium lilacinum TaxID=33203 RepID=A0A179H1G6_PURLI|nr:hypothetical protein VFPFJ_09124 [Purpureocillium lilacinum]OAQ83321.1 hypothetical protein VFPFJ_09124 [Purpureocillium lilacinum]